MEARQRTWPSCLLTRDKSLQARSAAREGNTSFQPPFYGNGGTKFQMLVRKPQQSCIRIRACRDILPWLTSLGFMSGAQNKSGRPEGTATLCVLENSLN